MSNQKFSFLKKHTVSQQADYICSYLPNDETFESKTIANTNFRNMLEVFGMQLKSFEQFLNIFTKEMDPSCALNLLEEWEKMLGIPDDCFVVDGQTLADRQRNALIKLSKMSVQTNEDFTNLAQSFGIVATVQSGVDFVNDGGAPFAGGDNEARFTIVITFLGAATEVFPFTFPIIFGSAILGILECVFKKIKPANCNMKFIEEIPEALGDYYWAMGESSGNLIDIASGSSEEMAVSGFPAFLQTSLRVDLTGNSIFYSSFNNQSHRLANLILPYQDGITAEVTVKAGSFTNIRASQFSGAYDGRVVHALSSKDNSFANSAWIMRFDNFDDLVGQPNTAVPVFTVLNRSLYITTDAHATVVVAEIRGTTEVVFGDTYHLMMTIRPSNNTIQFWVNGVSQGSGSIPSDWYRYNSGTNLGVPDLLDGTRTSIIGTGLDISEVNNSLGSSTTQDIKIHLLEADDAFALRQSQNANFT